MGDEGQDDELDEDDLAQVLGLRGGAAADDEFDEDQLGEDEDQDDDQLDEDDLADVLGLQGGAAMKAMKAMKKSKIAKGKLAKAVVFRGNKEKTIGGLQKKDLVKNKRGSIVSKKQQAKGNALYSKYAKKWITAVMAARKSLGVKGFVAIKKGTPLYAAAKKNYR